MVEADVAPEGWASAVEQAKGDGFDLCLDLVAIDEIGREPVIRLVLLLENADTGERRHLATRVDREHAIVDGVTRTYPAAAWLQRQVHDFFGVQFTGDDNRPLLNHAGGAPLRKDVLLAPRAEVRWPGALEPGESDASPSRRRLVPPGVPEPGLLDDPAATAADIALSAAGARVGRAR